MVVWLFNNEVEKLSNAARVILDERTVVISPIFTSISRSRFGEPRNAQPAGQASPRLQRQRSAQAGRDRAHEDIIYLPDFLEQSGLVNGRNLADIHNRCFREAGGAFGEHDVSRSRSEAKVRCEHNDDDRCDCASIEGIGRDDDGRTNQARFRSARLAEISPPNRSSPDHHSDLLIVRREAPVTARSDGTFRYT